MSRINISVSISILFASTLFAASVFEIAAPLREEPLNLKATSKPLKDMNADNCALLRVESDVAGELFITDVTVYQRDKVSAGVFEFYLSYRERNVTFTSPGYMPFRYKLPIALEKGKAYSVGLTVNSNNTQSGIRTNMTNRGISKIFDPTDTLAAGTTRLFKLGNSGEEIEMCWIPAGNQMIGSLQEETDRETNDNPQTQVRIYRGFWIGKYEITQKQWKSVMPEEPPNNVFNGNDLPIYGISWDRVQHFEKRLNGDFRLPTEDEWEYACRAETNTRFYWGDDPDYREVFRFAWCNSNSGSKPHRVGDLLPNYWGLHDMSGNVWEWCEDKYQDFDSNPSDAQTPDSIEMRVLRGGSWSDLAKSSRSSSRTGMAPNLGLGSYGGFRLVMSSNQ